FVNPLRVRWQSQVLQDDQWFVAAQFVDGGTAILGGDDVVLLEAPAKLAQQAGIIFDDKEFSARVAQADPQGQGIGGLRIVAAPTMYCKRTMLPRRYRRLQIFPHGSA